MTYEGKPAAEVQTAPERGGPLARRLGLVLGIALFLFLLFWPDLPLDSAQRRVAAVTALTATCWLTLALPIAATSMMPAATPPNAVVFGSRLVPPAGMARAGLAVNFLAVILLTLLFQLWVAPLWGIGEAAPPWAGR